MVSLQNAKIAQICCFYTETREQRISIHRLPGKIIVAATQSVSPTITGIDIRLCAFFRSIATSEGSHSCVNVKRSAGKLDSMTRTSLPRNKVPAKKALTRCRLQMRTGSGSWFASCQVLLRSSCEIHLLFFGVKIRHKPFEQKCAEIWESIDFVIMSDVAFRQLKSVSDIRVAI